MAILREMIIEDRIPVIDIFNYYIEHSFAAYLENKLPYALFEELFFKPEGYPRIVVEEPPGTVVGFGRLRPYSPIPTFKRTAEITYFLQPNRTGQGLGTLMLKSLLSQAKSIGISSILANISSLNEGSVRFHSRNGFKKCGQFNQIGIKKGTYFDVVYMQLELI